MVDVRLLLIPASAAYLPTNIMWYRSRHRPGVTLVELILFLAIAAIVGLAIIPLLFSSTENRLLQESISLVENNGGQIMQIIGKNVRGAEKILTPPAGTSAKVMALQTASGATYPTIFGILTGALLMIQKTNQQAISSTEVAVQNFQVRNVSNGTSTGVIISFTVLRTLRLEAPRVYTQYFESWFTLYPKNITTGNSCGAALPGCIIGSNRYTWQVCSGTGAQNAAAQMTCP